MRFRGSVFSILALLALAIPASATISYSSCSSGCTVTNGTYATWQTAAGANFTFSNLPNAPITFVSAGLNGSGVYTDSGSGTGGTGTIFTNFNGSNVDQLQIFAGTTNIRQLSTGTNTGIEILLPVNTYAFAAIVDAVTFNMATVGLGDHTSHATNYSLTLSGGSALFFGIISNSPISSLFISSGSSSSRVIIDSFELGSDPPSDTPEASTLMMIGSGLIGFRLLRRRRQTRLRRA